MEVINASNGRSYSTEVKLPATFLTGPSTTVSPSGHGQRPQDRPRGAEELGLPMFVGSTLGQIWQAANAQGYGAEGHTAIYAFLSRNSRKKES